MYSQSVLENCVQPESRLILMAGTDDDDLYVLVVILLREHIFNMSQPLQYHMWLYRDKHFKVSVQCEQGAKILQFNHICRV